MILIVNLKFSYFIWAPTAAQPDMSIYFKKTLCIVLIFTSKHVIDSLQIYYTVCWFATCLIEMGTYRTDRRSWRILIEYIIIILIMFIVYLISYAHSLFYSRFKILLMFIFYITSLLPSTYLQKQTHFYCFFTDLDAVQAI